MHGQYHKVCDILTNFQIWLKSRVLRGKSDTFTTQKVLCNFQRWFMAQMKAYTIPRKNWTQIFLNIFFCRHEQIQAVVLTFSPRTYIYYILRTAHWSSRGIHWYPTLSFPQRWGLSKYAYCQAV